MDENLEQGTNNNTDSANGGTPQDTNTQDQQSTILGGGGDTNTDQPAEPIVYDFSTAFEGGEVDQTIADEFSKMLNGVGATQEQALEMAKFGNQYATNLVTAYENNAREVLGNKFDATVSQAAAGVEAVEKTIPNIREILAENGLGNRVEVIQLFAHIAGMASEDNNAGNGQGGSTYISEEERAKMLYPSMK